MNRLQPVSPVQATDASARQDPHSALTPSAATAASRRGVVSTSAAVYRCFFVSLLTAAAVFSSVAVAQEAHEGKSNDEIARELANPNTSLASLKFRNQYRWYKGDLPGADDQSNYTLLFQPVFPFPLAPTKNGGKPNVYLRPAIPLVADQPVPELSDQGLDYNKTTALGDIGFDLAYGVTEKNGFLWALGMVGTLPTATDSAVAGKQLRLGPEILLAKGEKWGLFGIFPNHQWNLTGWGEGKDNWFSTTTIQPFLKLTPGGGWAIASEPIMSYDWKAEQWTVPVNLTVNKTTRIGKTPVNFEVEINYYVDQPDAFGPEWMIALNITPIVPNVINNWIRGK
ncbi:MAG: hypothetical protein PVJ30_04975 [Thiohalocapsa sp.]|jgi:hypothetical protein